MKCDNNCSLYLTALASVILEEKDAKIETKMHWSVDYLYMLAGI